MSTYTKRIIARTIVGSAILGLCSLPFIFWYHMGFTSFLQLVGILVIFILVIGIWWWAVFNI